MNMTYAGTGVDYEAMDPFKKRAQKAGRETAQNLDIFRGGNFREFEPSRGESAYLIETRGGFLAHVEEGLGTKNLVADEMWHLHHDDTPCYGNVAQCTVAMIVNDMITVGALPLSVAMHLAVENSHWFKVEARVDDLISGWKNACDMARCVWGGGETPTLKDVVVPGTFVLSGSAIGFIHPKGKLIAGPICHGDAIVLVESSGIHANGLTLAREIADKLPGGYLTHVPGDGREYGSVLLDPTMIYVGLVEECQKAGVEIHYAANITGHGWRKLMRATQQFTYVIDKLPTQLPIFAFIQEHGPVDDKEAYGNLNMGAGFALYVSSEAAPRVCAIAGSLEQRAFIAGYVEDGEKRVVIRPVGLEYGGNTLAVR